MSNFTTKYFFERLANLIESEQPMALCLKQLAEEFAGSAFEQFANEVHTDVFDKGLSLTMRMHQYPQLFSQAQIELVAEAERTGELVTNFKKAAEVNS